MFQNGMSEEVQNYFVQEDASKHHAEAVRPYQADQGMFGSQFVDPRTQMMGQHFPQFPYIGSSLPHKISNGDYFDPRMQNRGQTLHHQQQQQQHQQQQQYFEPVQQHQLQQTFDHSYQAMQMEKLARQQELLLGGHSHGLGGVQQQLVRPQMGTAQVDSFPMNMRNTAMQASPVYGLANDSFGQQMLGKPSNNSMFSSGISESEALDNLHDLFGGVEKIFADDPVPESKSSITGLGSLGASLINGCEAELFGDGGTPFFGRVMQTPFKQSVVDANRISGHSADRQLDQGNYSQSLGQVNLFQGSNNRQIHQPPAPTVNDGHFQQYGQGIVQHQPLTRVELQGNERWQQNSKNLTDNHPHSSLHNAQQNSQMSRGTLQLFKDMDESDNNSGLSGYQSSQAPMLEQAAKPQVNCYRETRTDSQDAFRPVGTAFSLGVQDGQRKTESPQLRFPQNSAEGGFWLKDSNMNSKFQPNSAGEVVSHHQSRLQPDRLLLDPGKQHQSQEVQNLLSYANSNASSGQHGGSMISQASENVRMHNHQNDPPLRSRVYFDALEQHKQQTPSFQPEGQHSSQPYSNGSASFFHGQGNSKYDSVGEGKSCDIQTGALPWNVSNARQIPSDSMQRGNSIEPSVSFRSPVPKPNFASSTLVQNEKPSSSEATKRRDELFANSGVVPTTSSSSTLLMDPEKQSSSGPQPSENLGNESAELRTPTWPQLTQTFQDVSRRQAQFLPKSDVRSSALTDRQNATPSPAVFASAQVKEKEDKVAPKVFESSALINTSKPACSSPSPSTVPFHQDKSQLLQTHLNSLSRVNSDMHRFSRDFSAQPTSSAYGFSQHKPAESDSINDIVQLQHQSRVGPSAAQVPVAPSPQPPPSSKPEQTATSAVVTASVEQQPSTDGYKASSIPEGKVPPGKSAELVSSDDLGNNNESSSVGKVVAEQQTNQANAVSIANQNQQAGANLLSMSASGLAQSNLAAIAHAKLIANQQILQVPKELQPVDLQQRLPNSQISQVSLHQQRVQAALQAYALSKIGYGGASAGDQSAGTSGSLPPGKSEPAAAVVQAATLKQQLMMNSSTLANSAPIKKRKIEVPPLTPWRTAITQLTGALPTTTRPPELQWAIDTNRLPDKDVDEDSLSSQDESMQIVGRARQRLKLTTQLMQNSLPPVPAALMQSNTLDDRESALYVLARLSLGDACRIAASADGPQAKSTLSATSELIIEGFKDRIKYLERALQRLESLPLTLEFVKNMQYLDKICVTNRLMKCHQELFPVNFTSQRRIHPIQRSYAQPLVTPLPIPDTFPEEFQLISL